MSQAGMPAVRLNKQADILTTNTAPTFESGYGIVTTYIDGSGANTSRGGLGCNTVTFQDDGKILLGGSGGDYKNGYFVMVRYNADGSLDSSFGNDGIVKTKVGNNDIGYSATVQTDGKILLGGVSYKNGFDFTLVRYNTDGSLDDSFDNDGIVTTDINKSADIGYSVTVQSDGKVLLGGYSNDKFSLVRYNADGSLDSSFGNDGKVVSTTGLAGPYIQNNSVSLQVDGKILLGGTGMNGKKPILSLVRYNTDGTLDTNFGNDGKINTNVGGNSYGNSVAIQIDGKILLGGYSLTTNNYDFTLVRYNTDGSLDDSFGNKGIVITDVSKGGHDYSFSVAIQSDGKILLGGNARNPFLVRYNTDGSLDNNFGNDGIVTTTFNKGEGKSQSYSVAVQDDGKILLGGDSYISNTGVNFDLVRYNTDGSLDNTFYDTNISHNAHVTTNTLDNIPLYTENSASIVLDSTVQIYDAELIAQGNYNDSSITLVRHGGASNQDIFSSAGSLSFTDNNAVLSGVTIGTVSNTNGTLTINFNSNATQGLVNEALSSLAYSNTSDAPPASVKIDWTFSDGNTSGALTALGSTTVNIIAVNDLPIGNVTIIGTAEQGEVLTASNDLTDADGLGTITYQWKAGDTNIGTGNTYRLTQSDVGKIITATARYTDGQHTVENVTSATTDAALNINDLPTGNVKITGITKQNEILTVSNTLVDADGLKTISYQWKANGVDIGTGNTYKLTDAEADKTITVTASYTDNYNTAESVSSAATAMVTKNFKNYETYGDVGGSATDILTGASGTDRLYGLNKGDELSGYDNNDSLYGGYGNDSIYGGDGNDKLYGEQDNDYMDGGAGNDTLDGGLGADTMIGGAGNDTYYLGYDAADVIIDNGLSTDIDTVIMPYQLTSYTLPHGIEKGTIAEGTKASSLTGNDSDNELTGNDGNNMLVGAVGRDSLFGGVGNDVLVGGDGNDTLSGGTGKDTFKFDTTLTDNADKITDFAPVDDTIQLDHAVFTQLTKTGVLNTSMFVKGTAAIDNNDYIIYNATTGAVTYDADGNGADAGVQIAMLGVNLPLTNADFVVI